MDESTKTNPYYLKGLRDGERIGIGAASIAWVVLTLIAIAFGIDGCGK